MTTERRRTGLLAMIIADPWRKLLAVALAILAWFLIDSRVMRTVKRTVPLVTVGAQAEGGAGMDRLAVALPTDKVVGLRFRNGEEPIDRVEVVVTGPRYRVTALQDEQLDLQVTRFLALDWESRTSVEITAADLRRDRLGLEQVSIRLVPPRIFLEVVRIAQRAYLLSLDNVEIVDDQLTDRLRRDTAEWAPREAVVLGPAIGIDRLGRRAGKPFRAILQPGAGSGVDRQVTAQLEIVDGKELGLRFQTPPLLTMQVLPQTTKYEVELPIVVIDQALPPELRGAWQPDTRTRTVWIAAGGELRATLVNLSEGGDRRRLQEWAAANLCLLVHIPRPEAGTVPPAQIDRPARLLLLGRLAETVDRNECLLAETVVVNLRRQP